MTGILSPHPLPRRGIIPRSAYVRSRSGIITRDGTADPLAGIPTTLRLQTHRGEPSAVPYDVVVEGSANPDWDGLYRHNGYFDGKPAFQHPSGETNIIWFSGWSPHPVWLLNRSTGGPAYGIASNAGRPPEGVWQDFGGGSPAPTITLVPHQRLAPLGLYLDTACTLPATADGDAIAAWRDESSGSGLVAVQSVSTKRPTLRFVSGVPVLAFDGVDDFLTITDVPAISGVIGAAVTGMYDSSIQANGRILAMADASGMDWAGGTGYVAALRPGSAPGIGVQYLEPYPTLPVSAEEWFTFASRATGSAIETWKNGANKMAHPADTTAIASTRVKIGGSFAYSDAADLWGGYIGSVAFGPWTEQQTLRVQSHFSQLRPS